MKLINQSLCFIAAMLLICSCSTDPINESEELTTNLEAPIEVENDTELALEVLAVLNAHRATLGLSELQWHNYSEDLALGHSNYMVIQSEPSHDNFYARSASLQNNGAHIVSENVAYGYMDAESVVQGWLGSPSHKQALEGDYTHTGIGIVKNEMGVPYYTQLFFR
ncbi:CAP domain-containing protein [uncultured Dokdonia sp.]|uniref:CAP domain-containing protein n=1 Tax=Dokdonia sp. Asnod2-E02 TaxID=3160574 RepID=UPI00261AA42F|nr:CAP domain-containing protein [uncultured Dokdonia sp.]